jgi:putative membrane protein
MRHPSVAKTPLAIALVMLGFSAAALAESTLARSDVKFLKEAAAGNLAEVDLGKLAQEKALREEVKEFAKRMVDDHTAANDELKKVASANGVELPAAPDKKEQKERAQLDKLIGGDFDRAYMKLMVADHKKDVHEFKEHAKARKDGDAKAYAAQTLPTLQEHLAMALKTNDIVLAPKRTGNRETGSTKK